MEDPTLFFLVTTTPLAIRDIRSLACTSIEFASLLRQQNDYWWNLQVRKLLDYDISDIQLDSRADIHACYEWRRVHNVLSGSWNKYRIIASPVCVRILLRSPSYRFPYGTFDSACNLGYSEVVSMLMDNNIPSQSELNEGFTYACWTYRVEIVRILLTNDRVLPSVSCREDAYLQACGQANGVIVKLLLELAPLPSVACLEKELLQACLVGNTSYVYNILRDKRVDPSVQDNQALISACKHHKSKIVKMLLRDVRVDPTARAGLAYKLAKKRGYTRTMALLTSDSRWKYATSNNNLDILLVQSLLLSNQALSIG